jgi:hypothetical protein
VRETFVCGEAIALRPIWSDLLPRVTELYRVGGYRPPNPLWVLIINNEPFTEFIPFIPQPNLKLEEQLKVAFPNHVVVYDINLSQIPRQIRRKMRESRKHELIEGIAIQTHGSSHLIYGGGTLEMKPVVFTRDAAVHFGALFERLRDVLADSLQVYLLGCITGRDAQFLAEIVYAGAAKGIAVEVTAAITFISGRGEFEGRYVKCSDKSCGAVFLKTPGAPDVARDFRHGASQEHETALYCARDCLAITRKPISLSGNIAALEISIRKTLETEAAMGKVTIGRLIASDQFTGWEWLAQRLPGITLIVRGTGGKYEAERLQGDAAWPPGGHLVYEVLRSR